MNEVVTVIVPVYNINPYIDQCVESICLQSYSFLQILLVDDGSTDGSGEKCDAWEAKDKRIRVIHKENGGASEARNAGLDIAYGDYLLFLDGDDFYPCNNFIENLLRTAHEKSSDVVCCNYTRYKEKDKKMTDVLYNLVGEDSLENLVRQNIFQSSACLKLTRRNLIAKNHLRFKPGVVCEDILFCLQLLLCAQTVAFCADAIYAYRIRIGSVTQSLTSVQIGDLLKILEECVQLCENSSSDKKDYAFGYLAFQYSTLLINIHLGKATKQQKEQAYKYDWLLRYGLSKEVSLIARCQSILGVRITSILLFVYFKIVS